MNIREELHRLIDQLDEDTAAVALVHLRERFGTSDSIDDVPGDDWSKDESVDAFVAEIRELRRQDGYAGQRCR